jgi:hypothetical protein
LIAGEPKLRKLGKSILPVPVAKKICWRKSGSFNNSPQVLFFPILRQMELRGQHFGRSLRAYVNRPTGSQLGFSFTTIGKHGAEAYVIDYQNRSQLLPGPETATFDLCVSHNSYSQIVAVWLKFHPLLNDCEHQLNHLCLQVSQPRPPETF